MLPPSSKSCAKAVFFLTEKDEKRAALDQIGIYVNTPSGNSMRPMLRGERDMIRVEKHEGRLSRYDVALYCRRDGKHVLHRVVRVREHDYVMRGDNCDYTEYGITDEMVIGKLVGFWRGEKYIACESRAYRLYARLRNLFYPLRFLRLRLWHATLRLLRRSKLLRAIWRRVRGRRDF